MGKKVEKKSDAAPVPEVPVVAAPAPAIAPASGKGKGKATASASATAVVAVAASPAKAIEKDKVEKKKRKKDPNAPKRSLSAYMLFAADERAVVKKEHPDMQSKEIVTEIGVRWVAAKNRNDPRVKHYETRAAEDAEKYRAAVAAYKCLPASGLQA